MNKAIAMALLLSITAAMSMRAEDLDAMKSASGRVVGEGGQNGSVSGKGTVTLSESQFKQLLEKAQGNSSSEQKKKDDVPLPMKIVGDAAAGAGYVGGLVGSAVGDVGALVWYGIFTVASFGDGALNTIKETSPWWVSNPFDFAHDAAKSGYKSVTE